MKYLLRMALATGFVLHISAHAFAQPPTAPATPPLEPPRQPPASPPTSSAAARPAATSLTVSVRVTDKSGNGIGEVSVAATGPVDRSAVTARDGTVTFKSMRQGQYRLRFEHEGYVTLEREQMINRQASEVMVALNPAPPVKPVVAPPPEPAKPAERPPAPSTRVVEPRFWDIPDYVERNLIGSEPQKTTTIACTDGGTARILQVRDPLNDQAHADFDELLYVVAGSGIVRVKDKDMLMNPGGFMLVPRGVTHSLRRDKRTPMIALSMFLGAPCSDAGGQVVR